MASKDVLYRSTRGNFPEVSSADAILRGLSPSGGLFVPFPIPAISLDELKDLSYQDLALKVIRRFLTDFDEKELKDLVHRAYNLERFDAKEVCPVHYLDEKTGVVELWHGPTAAFKDVALQITPLFLVSSAKSLNVKEEVVVLVATSGDTGKAALEGFKDVKGTRIIVFYPKDGVSAIQERQMITTTGSNTTVIGVRGNFDDCQTMVKAIFGDIAYNEKLKARGFRLSSANSINWGRLVPQVSYYFSSYMDMVRKGSIKLGDKVNFCVPTGNFGDILAGHYAFLMGLPVKRFILASNSNKVLTDLLETGVYDNSNRVFKTTCSPSMDILISSNLERLLYEYADYDDASVRGWYDSLKKDKKFEVSEKVFKRLKDRFVASFATEEETMETIARVFKEHKYVVDTHTAVALTVFERYRKESGDDTPTLIMSTASPFKFIRACVSSLTNEPLESLTDEFPLIPRLEALAGVPTHRAVEGLLELDVLHKLVIDVEEGPAAVLKILDIAVSE